ncbi:hypothetical protein [Methylobacter sp. S3L5C]|uniref:hypothetical protein n=1 Tax=Methylobacter sp. S3L5C TaxID=2839024 RepID=UPI001FAC2B52|nr:hypothetical protein [Methylobacter sp. S3L5C]UOA08316.1 hypothetical protein KKZ03_19270 [Methylobacter sp. S3L5C]
MKSGFFVQALTTEWKTIHKTFRTVASPNATYGHFYFFPLEDGFTLNVASAKLEEGNTYSAWSPTVAEIANSLLIPSITAAAANATEANTAIANISSNSVFSPNEKIAIRREWEDIWAEKAVIRSQCAMYGIDDEAYWNTVIDLATYLNGNNWWDAWSNSYVLPAWINDENLSLSTDIVSATFNNYFSVYYYWRVSTIQAITDSAATRANWSVVSGEGKPADNATRNVFRNAWLTGTVYALGDIVLDSIGYGWSCVQAHTSSASVKTPTYLAGSDNKNTYWSLFILKGETGQIGLPGKDGFVFNPVIDADFAGNTLPTGFTFPGTVASSDFNTATRITNTVADQKLVINGGFNPADSYIIIIRVKWVAGGWEGNLYYSNTLHGYSATQNIYMPQPVFNEWTLITIDTRTLPVDYISGGLITILDFDFINNVGDSVVLDYIMVGKYGIPSLSGIDIKTKLQEVINDPLITPLTFNADAFVINVNGIDNPPFILGNIAGAPALLLDASVSVTGPLSASQITSGKIAATEKLTIGNGSLLIDGGSTGDASIIVYKGPETIVNRDLAILSSGDLSFMKYREGAYRTYKNVQRVVYGVAESGTTVTIDGWWDAQPIIQVSTYALTSYLKAYGAQDQSWQIRADNLREVASTTVGVITQQGLALIGSAETKNNTGYISNIGSSTGGKQAYAGNTITEDCYIEFKFDSAPCSIGFSIGASNPAIDTINYVMALAADGSLAMKANGVTLLAGGIFPLTNIWRIYRIGAEINFARVNNGAVSYRKAVIPVGEAISVDSYLGAGSAISGINFWKRLPPAPSGKWQFDAVADLTLSNSSGNTVVTSQSGTTGVNAWTSGESALIANTVSATVAVQFSSVQGTGTGTYGYYYRSVTWTIQGWNGSSWINLATKTRAVTAAEHGVSIVDTNAVNLTSTYTKIRAYFSVANTNGTGYSLGSDVYNYQEVSKDITGGSDSAFGSGNVNTFASGATSLTYDLGDVTPSSGFAIHEVTYTTNWTLFANSSQSAATFGISSTGFSRNTQAGATLRGSLSASATSYDRYFWKAAISGYGTCFGNCNTLHATIKSRQLIVNSAAISNDFTFSSYAWAVAGSTVLAKGSLNYIAIGN